MQAQSYDGYIENGHFYPKDKPIYLPGRFRAVLTVLDVPTLNETPTKTPKWLSELHHLLDESEDEKLSMDDFPRANLTREHLEVKP